MVTDALRLALDPLPAFHFIVLLLHSDGLPRSVAGFSECSGIEATLETEEYMEGGQNDRVHKFPTRFTYTNLSLRRGVTLTSEFRDWYLEMLQGKVTRRDGLIIVMNELRLPAVAWKFVDGLPVRYIGPALNAASSEVAIEALEISYEKIEPFDVKRLVTSLL